MTNDPNTPNGADVLAALKRKMSAESKTYAAVAALISRNAELEAVRNVRDVSMTAILDTLQRIAPWSESNDMEIVDEIMCGLGLLAKTRDNLIAEREVKPAPVPARAVAEWQEDDGVALWFAWCGHDWAGEPAWAGTPLDSDWPGYHTHWIPHPSFPSKPDAKREVSNDGGRLVDRGRDNLP